jgi:hypothetical protein
LRALEHLGYKFDCVLIIVQLFIVGLDLVGKLNLFLFTHILDSSEVTLIPHVTRKLKAMLSHNAHV